MTSGKTHKTSNTKFGWKLAIRQSYVLWLLVCTAQSAIMLVFIPNQLADQGLNNFSNLEHFQESAASLVF